MATTARWPGIEAPKRTVHELAVGEHAGVIGDVARVDR